MEGHEVVLTERIDLDVLHQHHLVMAEVERRGEHICGASAAGRPASRRTSGRRAAGVSRRPSRSGSSPMAISSSRTAAAARSWSKGLVTTSSWAGAMGSTTGALAGLRHHDSAPCSTRRAVACSVTVSPASSLRLRTGPRSDTGRSVDDSQIWRCCRLRRSARRSQRPRACRASRGRAARRPGVEHVSVLAQDLVGLLVCGLEERPDLSVDDFGHLLAVVALVAHVTSEEDLALALAEAHGARPCRSCRTA